MKLMINATEKMQIIIIKIQTRINNYGITDKRTRSFFQAVIVLILLYECTTWTLTTQLEKKLDGNYTRMLRAILNRFWRQHPSK